MTRQEQNNIIMQQINATLQDQSVPTDRVAKVFNTWFQGLLAAGTASPMPEEETPPQQEEQVA